MVLLNVVWLRYVDASFGTGWWYEGGGLIRHNHLVATSPTHLEQDGTWTHTKDIVAVEEQETAGSGVFVAGSASMVTSAEVRTTRASI
jgi:hypothetical protein